MRQALKRALADGQIARRGYGRYELALSIAGLVEIRRHALVELGARAVVRSRA